MPERNLSVAIFPSPTQAKAAVKELERLDFDLQKVSIVSRYYPLDGNIVGHYKTGDRMKYFRKQGAESWGGIWWLLFGATFFFIPGVGPLVVGGPLVHWIVGRWGGTAVDGGVSSLGVGLARMGIPRDRILQYESAIRSGQFILILHGTPEEVEDARQILDQAKAVETHLHVEELVAMS